MRTKKICFLFFNQNICCGYSKEPSRWDSSFEHPQHKVRRYLQFFRFKFFIYLNLWRTKRAKWSSPWNCILSRSIETARWRNNHSALTLGKQCLDPPRHQKLTCEYKFIIWRYCFSVDNVMSKIMLWPHITEHFQWEQVTSLRCPWQ